jgi:hypothetical protein
MASQPTAAPSRRQRVAKAWSKVTPHDLVEIKGRLYAVVKIKTKGDALKVTIRDTDTGEEYASKVDPKHGVDVVELAKPAPRKKWTAKPTDDAEKAVVEILGATPVGDKPGADEVYVCPPLDITTIAGHLYIFHGITGLDLRKPDGWVEARSVHENEHEKPIDQLHVPHRHEKTRPETQIGPRFT